MCLGESRQQFLGEGVPVAQVAAHVDPCLFSSALECLHTFEGPLDYTNTVVWEMVWIKREKKRREKKQDTGGAGEKRVN